MKKDRYAMSEKPKDTQERLVVATAGASGDPMRADAARPNPFRKSQALRDRVSARARALGLTEEKLQELLYE